jgi:uncharacterized protein (TIGR02172 family)
MTPYPMWSRIDSANVDAFEKEIREAFPEGFPDPLVLDAAVLSYISSAGLRMLLRLQKATGNLLVTHVNLDVYDIFEMTGFSELLRVEKAMRQISIEGCPEIGRGAHGVVYRIAPDTIVKVYHPGESLEAIRKEKELSRWAFINGIPTAIPYDIVRVGDQYGTVFELLDSRSAADYIMESPEHLEDYARRSVSLLKLIHSITVEPGTLPNMKKQMLEWMDSVRLLSESGQFGELPEGLCARLDQMIRDTPDTLMLLHADPHLKNIMICGDELMIIDMDTLCTGDPIFDLATLYNSYREFPSIDPEAAAFLGIDLESAYRLCDLTMAYYLQGTDPAEQAETLRRARIFGCVRIISYMMPLTEMPARDRILQRCLQDIAELMAE